jgi:hypothetical protein
MLTKCLGGNSQGYLGNLVTDVIIISNLILRGISYRAMNRIEMDQDKVKWQNFVIKVMKPQVP